MPDSFGCFVPMANRLGPFVNVLPSRVSPAASITGHGTPEGAVPGVPGQRYDDLDTNNIYIKIAGTSVGGWQLVGVAASEGAVPGGSGSVLTWDGTGVMPAATGAAFLIGTGVKDGWLWKKTTTTANNTDWEVMIQP